MTKAKNIVRVDEREYDRDFYTYFIDRYVKDETDKIVFKLPEETREKVNAYLDTYDAFKAIDLEPLRDMLGVNLLKVLNFLCEDCGLACDIYFVCPECKQIYDDYIWEHGEWKHTFDDNCKCSECGVDLIETLAYFKEDDEVHLFAFTPEIWAECAGEWFEEIKDMYEKNIE